MSSTFDSATPTTPSLSADTAAPAPKVKSGHTLINRLKTAPNTKFQVNGNHYELDDRGVVEGVKEEDVHVLMQHPHIWVKHDPSKSIDSVVPRKSVVALLDDKGNHYQVNNHTDRPSTTVTPLASDDGKVAMVSPVQIAQGQIVHSDNPKHNPSLHVHAKVPDAEQTSAAQYRHVAMGKEPSYLDKKVDAKPTASGELGEPTLEALTTSGVPDLDPPSDPDGKPSRKRR